MHMQEQTISNKGIQVSAPQINLDKSYFFNLQANSLTVVQFTMSLLKQFQISTTRLQKKEFSNI